MTQNDVNRLEDYLRHEANKYLLDADVTPDERREVLEWVKSGNSVYCNPWYLYDDGGHSMDYITAMRTVPDLATADWY
ncbi:hypothetical protein LJC64_04780 [Ruminococcaceae bacterium OttesenSCG-928-A11]|nr:hypothetical protein [Ruminococcaceae bacterium OttesenSCG-928-I18]MDL2327942.1 hypothetical protein [Ruminococcaceae bacterium OttesenSCG-928-A11]